MKKEKRSEPITFQRVYNQFKKKLDTKELLDDLKLLLGLAGAFLGNPAGAPFEAVFAALASKTIIIDAGQKLLKKAKDLEAVNYSGRIEKMRIAYSLIYYTAFFDTLNDEMPESIRGKIALCPEEQRQFCPPDQRRLDRTAGEKHDIAFPNICFGLNEVDECLTNLYQDMARGVEGFVGGLAFGDTASEEELAAFRQFIKELPKHSLIRFHDQYLTLCADFPAFRIFTDLKREQESAGKIDSLVALATRSQTTLEAGLIELKDAIKNLPREFKREEVRTIAEKIYESYQDDIKKPLIDHDESDSEEDTVVFPPIDEAFIPQAYKLIKYKGETLGSKDTWEDLDTHQDMTSFWAKYVTDADSIDSLLLILGEPGGGKSLLSRMISARLSSQSSAVIRIPLREYDVQEYEIESMVCARIEEDGDSNTEVSKFKWFAEEFPDDAITLIFDGYDEVQQATGMVYRQFLRKLQKFQRDCNDNRRPVRIIVTSRETLIDKAEIPKETTVMKLLPFDEPRKNAFINVWNRYNHDVLSANQLSDFALPAGNQDIDLLSSQPLLLTMLAIYDADFETGKNALISDEEKGERLDRTGLYDKLLRRFIRRELRKGKRKIDEKEYDELNETEQAEVVAQEMRKLGVAALGMFARDKLSIRIDELEEDFRSTSIVDSLKKIPSSAELRDAEAFLGSFFFIHDPRPKKEREGSEEDKKNASFEFLHKTFYEFLIADIVLYSLKIAVQYLQPTKALGRLYSDTVDNPNVMNSFFFASLGSACLCNEPEAIEMMTEWKVSVIDSLFGETASADVSAILKDLFDKHAEFIRNGSFSKLSEIKEKMLLSERPYPQSCAVYLLNLLTARIVINGSCEMDAPDWAYLSQYIKLNLPDRDEKEERKMSFQIDQSEETILRFMAQFTVEKRKGCVVFQRRQEVIDMRKIDLLQGRMEVFAFMQDDVSCQLYALHSLSESDEIKDQYRWALKEKGMKNDVVSELEISKLRRRVDGIFGAHKETEYEIYRCLRMARSLLRSETICTSYYLGVLSCLDRLVGYLYSRSGFEEHDKEQIIDCLHMSVEWYQNEKLRNAVREIIMKLVALVIDIDRGEAVRYCRDIWVRFASSDYRICLELAVLLIDNAMFYDNSCHSFWLSHIDLYQCTASSHDAALLLKVLYAAGEHDMICDFCKCVILHLEEDSMWDYSEFTNLLRTGIIIGQIEWVHDLLESYGEKLLRRRVIRMTVRIFVRDMVELWSIAERVEAKHFLSEYNDCVLYENGWSGVFIWTEIQLSTRQNGEAIHAVDDFLARFDRAFLLDAKRSVKLLLRIIDSDGYPDQYKEITHAVQGILKRFQLLLIQSVPAAIDLLCWQGTKEMELYTKCVRMCFDYALGEFDTNYSDQLCGLVDGLNPNHCCELREYFAAQMKYIRKYNQSLADRITAKL